MASLRIVLAQLNLCVGDIAGNLQKHIHAAIEARDKLHAHLIVFPELGLTGYPPEDLLLRNSFLHAAEDALKQFVAQVKGIYCLIACPHKTVKGLYNACFLVRDGSIIGQYYKQRLPNYSVFDEYRYFIPGEKAFIHVINDVPIGFVICEDLWTEEFVDQTVAQGARVIVAINASPFEVDKHEQRLATLAQHAKRHHIPLLYVNHVGGQDEIIFDGGSMLVNEEGKLCEWAGFYQEKLCTVEMDFSQVQRETKTIVIPLAIERVYQGLVLAVRDYIEKNHFPGVLVGVSGGIDSALTLTMAMDALGQDRVRAILMPSRYTSPISLEDGKILANNLGVQYDVISIETMHEDFIKVLKPIFLDRKPDTTEENIQARCRAVILMALSNKFCSLVLTTGNRSEYAVGYCTLYGDMAGGFAVIKDIPKTMVYQLCRYRNSLSPVISKRTLERAPTAELAPNQKDEDTLPPYAVLDKIIYAYVNQGLSADEIVSPEFDQAMVRKIINMIHQNEYKRRQAAVGPRINYKSFGKDWRYPITNHFKG